MTRTHGQIESLKRIRETLNHEGIARFNTTGDIHKFLQNYDNEKEELFFTTERAVDLELEILETRVHYLKREYEQLKTSHEDYLDNKISELSTICEALAQPTQNAILEILHWYKQQILRAYQFILKTNKKNLIWLKTHSLKKSHDLALDKTNAYSLNRENFISERYEQKYLDLERTKSVCEGLYTLMAGAIGEHRVAKELEKLPDDSVLINDFSLRLDQPIYYRKEKSFIRSIQIDHLLITKAGIFILETKNWSKASIERLDLRSPIRQIQRTNFALYRLLNNEHTVNSMLKDHHWGQRKLPIYNVVAMIHHKPKGRFKHVSIKTLHELNGYINCIEPLFDGEEVKNIESYLMQIKD